jgi:glutaredoxin
MIFATPSPFRQFPNRSTGCPPGRVSTVVLGLAWLVLAGTPAMGQRTLPGRPAAPARVVPPPQAVTTQPAPAVAVPARSRRFRIEVFTKADCQQCAAALKFLEQLQTRRKDLLVTVTPVDTDNEQLKRYYALCQQQRVAKPGLPGVLLCDQLLIGYRDDQTTGRQVEELLTIEVFSQDGCPHCAAARRFLDGWQARTPGLPIVYRNLSREVGQLERMREIARRHNVASPNVPFFSLFGKIQVGYDRPETTGRQLQDLVEKYYPLEPDPQSATTPATPNPQSQTRQIPACAAGQRSRDEALLGESVGPLGRVTDSVGWGPVWRVAIWLAQSGQSTDDASAPEQPLAPAEVEPESLPALDEWVPAIDTATANSRDGPAGEAPPDTIALRGLGSISVSRLGLPLFTVLVGLVDGFNPCAMWVLIFLLSVLVGLNDRLKMALIAGVFVLVSGLAYFAFMAAWLTIFQLIGLVRWAQVLLGLLALTMGAIHIKDCFAFKKGVTLSIPEGAKPGLYDRIRRVVSAPSLGAALAGAIVLAVLVNIIELLCTAGLPALYTQILTYRQYPAWKNYAYLGLYNLAYMADDSLMVAVAVSSLSRRRLQEREGRWLKLLSGLVVVGLGLLLLFKPEWLV